jgi:hypothetical protein
MKYIRLVLVVQVVLGCGIAVFSLLDSQGAAIRHARISAYGRLLRENGTSADASRILDMTPSEFASFASAVARDALSARESLLLCGIVVAALGVAGLILVRRGASKDSGNEQATRRAAELYNRRAEK